MTLFADIAEDVRQKAQWRYHSTAARAQIKTLFTDGTLAMILYRLMQWGRRWRLAPLEMIFNKMNAVGCQCIIGRGAEFGPGFVMSHCQGVVISGTVRAGRNVVIEHQVTIGSAHDHSPTLGDDIFIGAGAKIIGPVTIGSHSKVGANAVVVDDVPEGATVVGIPAKVVRIRPNAQATQAVN